MFRRRPLGSSEPKMGNGRRRTMRERFHLRWEGVHLRQDIYREFLAEFLGMFVLILFGCGSVAQATLSRGELGGPLTIGIGFSLGVMTGGYIAGGVSGAHLNPAVSMAMVILRKLTLVKFLVYVVAQFLGAFAGSITLFGLYYNALMGYAEGKLEVTGDRATANIFATYPDERFSVLTGFVDQVIATAALMLGILAITDKNNIGAPKGMEPVIISLIIMAISVAMGLHCGYPLNPARDFGPRLFTAMAGWGIGVFTARGSWWWVPVVAPMIGAAVGVLIYLLCIGLHHPQPVKPEENNIQEEAHELITISEDLQENQNHLLNGVS